MHQVENEYGYQPECDFAYTSHLRDLVVASVGEGPVLFTTDGDDVDYLKCGKIPDVYATVDFGSSKAGVGRSVEVFVLFLMFIVSDNPGIRYKWINVLFS